MGKLHNEKTFRHVSYHATDLSKTFARIRRQQAETKAAEEANLTKIVRPIGRKKA